MGRRLVVLLVALAALVATVPTTVAGQAPMAGKERALSRAGPSPEEPEENGLRMSVEKGAR